MRAITVSYLPQTSSLNPLVVSSDKVVLTSNADVLMSSSVWKYTATLIKDDIIKKNRNKKTRVAFIPQQGPVKVSTRLNTLLSGLCIFCLWDQH